MSTKESKKCIDNYTAPVKLEFLNGIDRIEAQKLADGSSVFIDHRHESIQESNSTTSTINESGDTNERNKNSQVSDGGSRSKNKNKKRKHQNEKSQKQGVWRLPKAKIVLCPLIANQRKCAWGHRCKDSHDVKAYLAQKPNDIGGSCIQFQTHGWCRSGYTCRFGSSHIQQLTKTDTIESGDLPSVESVPELISESASIMQPSSVALISSLPHEFSPKDILNAYSDHLLPSFVLNQLRKKNYSFTSKQSSSSSSATLDVDIGNASLKSSLRLDGLLYLAPLTTLGKIPFRRMCIDYGCDVTCSEMALASELLQGNAEEWQLLQRHHSEKNYGIQLAIGKTEEATNIGDVLNEYILNTDTSCIINDTTSKFSIEQINLAQAQRRFDDHGNVLPGADFIDLNCGCPIDLITNKGMGSALSQPRRLCNTTHSIFTITSALCNVLKCPVSVKLRQGWNHNMINAMEILPRLYDSGATICTLHGRTRQQRYSKNADWAYIYDCARSVYDYNTEKKSQSQFIGGGDVYTFEDYNSHMNVNQYIKDAESLAVGKGAEHKGLTACMIGRGALQKPWLFTEIKEQRHWDISAQERLDMIKKFCEYGLNHWGSDDEGVEATRRYLLEWCSYLCRYVPVGLLEATTGLALTWRPPRCPYGRSDLEILLSSQEPLDWIKISEMFLGPVRSGYFFTPKHGSSVQRQSGDATDSSFQNISSWGE